MASVVPGRADVRPRSHRTILGPRSVCPGAFGERPDGKPDRQRPHYLPESTRSAHRGGGTARARLGTTLREYRLRAPNEALTYRSGVAREGAAGPVSPAAGHRVARMLGAFSQRCLTLRRL